MNGLGTIETQPGRDAARLAKLKRHLREGGSRYSFAKAAGITLQALLDWLERRPDYERQIAAYSRGHKSAPVTGSDYQARIEAIRKRQTEGLRWKQAAWPLGITEKALKQWYYLHKAEIDAHLASRPEPIQGGDVQGRAVA